jgi:DNA replication and repair protein RecF
VVGGNGQGKTNLLEAAYLALTGVLEAGKVETVIRIGEREAHVAAELEREDGTVRLEAGPRPPAGGVARVDGVRVRAGEVARPRLGRLGAAGGLGSSSMARPSPRRAYLDSLVSRVSPRYAGVIALYERALAQRNAALRRGARDRPRRA